MKCLDVDVVTVRKVQMDGSEFCYMRMPIGPFPGWFEPSDELHGFAVGESALECRLCGEVRSARIHQLEIYK